MLIGISKSLKFLKAYFKIGITRHFAYRGSLLIDSLGRILSLILLIFLWTTIFKSRDNVADLTLSSLLVYYIFANLVRILANPNTASMMGEQIKSGKLQMYLIKPSHPVLSFFGMTFARRIAECVFFLMLSLITIFFIFPYYGISVGTIHIGTFFAFLTIAIIEAYLIGTLVGLSAFWITDYAPLTYGLNPLTSILSGLMIPIALFPKSIQSILAFLPFKYMVSEPVLALQGKITGANIFMSMAIGIAWIIIFFFAINYIWKKGIHRFDAVGN